MNGLRIVLLGPPGVGKGTQANLLASKYKIPKISTGDILRKAIADNTALGQKAKQTISDGKLVSDDVIIGIIKDRLSQQDCQGGFILDGYPRTLAQAEALEPITPIDHVLSFLVQRSELIQRLEGRRTCRNCQKMYHIQFRPSKKDGICDDCGGELYQRKDDHRDTIEKRLIEYQTQTEPLIQYYSTRHLLREVNGVGTVEEVFEKSLSALDIQL